MIYKFRCLFIYIFIYLIYQQYHTILYFYFYYISQEMSIKIIYEGTNQISK